MEVGILIHDWLELVLAETISIDVVKSPVEELGLRSKEVFITTDDGLVAKLHMEVLLLQMAEADAVLAVLLLRLLEVLRDDIDLLVDLLVLLEDVLLYSVESRLQVLKKSDHELRVLCVLPGVETSLLWPGSRVLFQQLEVYME